MKEYQFQYTRRWSSVLLLLATMFIFLLIEWAALYFRLNIFVAMVLSLAAALLFFRLFKGKVIKTCKATLGEFNVIFEFDNETKTINFADLCSYKYYNGRSGAVLNLKSNEVNFHIAAGNSFVKTGDFEAFCEDVIVHLNQFRDKNISSIQQEGSIYGTNKMLYFLVIFTLIYLLGFLFESPMLRMVIRITGGFCLVIYWTRYMMETNKQ